MADLISRCSNKCCISSSLLLMVFAACSGNTATAPQPRADSQADKASPAEEFPPVVADESPASERRRLDESVYRQEVVAQRFEQPFVRLWDEMRAGAPFDALAKMSFNDITIGTNVAQEAGDWGIPGINIARFDPDQPLRLDHKQYQEQLTMLKKEGWQIDQSEWHHEAFQPAKGDNPPRSTVKFAIYGANSASDRRTILKGKLQVTWKNDGQAHAGDPTVDRVELLEARLVSLEGPPSFQPWFTIDARRDAPPNVNALQPIIVQDLNGDGLDEIVAAGANLLYWNRGGGQFEKAPLCRQVPYFSRAALVADFTGDGLLDIVGVVSAGSPLILLASSQDGLFTSAPRICLPKSLEHAQGLTAGDVDNDGDLDLYVFQYKAPYVGGQMPTPYYDANDGFPAYLLLNDGKGKFTDATTISGLNTKRFRRTYSASFVELNNDDKLDLVVVSDFAGIDIYHGDGNGHFDDVTDSTIGQRHGFGMSHTVDDFDGDGALDIFMIGMSSTTARRIIDLGIQRPNTVTENANRFPMGYGNRMYRNLGDRFVEPIWAKRVARTGWSWGVTSADFDNDGDRDLYVANGHISGQSCRDYCTRFWSHDIYTQTRFEPAALESVFVTELKDVLTRRTSWNGYEKNVLYLSQQGKDYLNVGHLLGAGFGFDSRSVVSGDFDLDGRVDLAVVELNQQSRSETLHVLHNQIPVKRHWIGIRLQQKSGGISAIGARITVDTGNSKRVHAVITGDSFMAQHSTTAHFGLGQDDHVKSIEVRWPNGRHVNLKEPDVDRYHTLVTPSLN